jgi:hypothetical protein
MKVTAHGMDEPVYSGAFFPKTFHIIILYHTLNFSHLNTLLFTALLSFSHDLPSGAK